jgi:hypothetical protein
MSSYWKGAATAPAPAPQGPTDAELMRLWEDAALPELVTRRLALSFARAVLVRWGSGGASLHRAEVQQL